VQSLFRLQGDSALWEYSFEGNVETSDRAEGAPVWRVNGKPTLTISARRDERRKANAGIALKLSTDGSRFEARRGGGPLSAQVEIRKADGELAHEGKALLDQFRFG
jgi:hypothetical protein